MELSLEKIEKAIQYSFKNKKLLHQALTHKSFQYESGKISVGNNETLEFLGDSVIDLAVSDLLMEFFPYDNEGQLSKRRASLVNEEVLAFISKEIGINQVLILGKGEKATGGAEKPRLLCSALEAVFGAVYKDGGYGEARSLAKIFFYGKFEKTESLMDLDKDYKTRYQELIQRKEKFTPTYSLLKVEGPPHDRIFEVTVCVEQLSRAKGTGRSKKQAEQDAARLALEMEDEKTI